MGKSTKAQSIDMDAKWRAESDLRTLAEAKAIKADPKRVKAVQELAQQQMVAAASAAAAVETKD